MWRKDSRRDGGPGVDHLKRGWEREKALVLLNTFVYDKL